ncbi:MAG: hypothetical protein AB1742_01800 [bacterium]
MSQRFFCALTVVFISLSCACSGRMSPEEVVSRGLAGAEKLTGLDAKHEIPAKLIETRGEMIDLMWKLFRDDNPPGRYNVLRDVAERLGYYIDTPDSEQELMELYVRGIAGVYDDKDNTAYVVSREARDEIREELRERGCRIWDYDESAWWEENVELFVMVHEMVHALQDQHYDLDYYDEKYKQNSDAGYAYSAIVEGMAEFVETEYIYNQWGRSTRDYLDHRHNLYRLLERVREYEFAGEELLEVGRDYCGEMMSYDNLMGFFKYTYGEAMAQEAAMEHGWKGVKELFNRYPLSTEQVVHPEKYFEEETLDLPTFVGYPDFYDVLPEDYAFLDSDSLGEFRIYLLIKDLELEPRDAINVSEGWDGDRYYAFRNPDTDEVAFGWITVWDTVEDADEFFNFYRKMSKRKSLSAEISGGGDDLYYVESTWGEGSVERDGDRVVIVEGFEDRELMDEFRGMVMSAETFEATYEHDETLPERLVDRKENGEEEEEEEDEEE